MMVAAALSAVEWMRRIRRRARLFEPAREPIRSWRVEDYGIARESAEEHSIPTPDGQQLFAWYLRARDPIASVLFCHGNSGNITNVAAVMPYLLGAGCNVLLFDYRGFGRSSGRASVSGVVSDVLTAASFHDSIRPTHLPNVLYGYSLGGAIAAQALRERTFDALILQSTFTSLRDLTRVLFPRLPLHFVARNLFDTARIVRDLTMPVLIIHGTEDEVIPSAMARQLYDACRSRKAIHLVDGALHKNVYELDGEALVRILQRFLPRHSELRVAG